MSEQFDKTVFQGVFKIDNVDFTAGLINTMKVIFDESWAPFQYVNLQEFIFGNVVEWTSDDVISLNLQEETDIISKVIPNDTLTLTIYSKDDDFNVLNPRSSYAYLLPNQKFSIREYIYEVDDETEGAPFNASTMNDLEDKISNMTIYDATFSENDLFISSV